MADTKLSNLAADTVVDYLYGEHGGVSKKIAPTNIVAGALVLVSTQTATASASLDFTGLSGTSWKLIGRLLVPTNGSGIVLGLKFGTSTGPTWSGSGYRYAGRGIGTGGFATDTSGESQAQIALGSSNNVTPGASFDLTIHTDNANFVIVNGTVIVRSTDGHDYSYFLNGAWATSVALTGVRLIEATGTIASGNASLYSLST